MNAQTFVEDAIAELKRANHDVKHPFRYFFLGTSAEGVADQRTVVMRKYKHLSLTVYTDQRSTKVAQLQAEQKCHALFWHPRKKLQIRAKAEARFEKEAIDASKIGGLNDYNTLLPPGNATDGKLEYATTFQLDNVLKLIISIRELDILQLDREQHLRAKATIEEKKILKTFWVVP